MNELLATYVGQSLMQLLALIGIVFLARAVIRWAHKQYVDMRERHDKLTRVPREFRHFVLARVQVLLDSGVPLDAKLLYDISNEPTARGYTSEGCRIHVDSVSDKCFILVVGNDKWRCKLLVPNVIPPHWEKTDWPLDVTLLNQCNGMYPVHPN